MLKAPFSIPSAPPMNAQPSSSEKGPPRSESSQSDLIQSTDVTFTESLQQLDQKRVLEDVQEIRSTASTFTASPSAPLRRHTRSSSTLAQFFAAGAFFSPPCSRVGLVSSSPFAKRATVSIGHALQVQVGAERNLEASTQAQQMVWGTRRTLSNLNAELQHPSQEQLQPSVSSLLRPILTLLTVHTTTAGISNDDPMRTDSGCEDLPSPIYGRHGDGENTGSDDNDDDGKGMHYAFETDAVEPFEPSSEFPVSTTLDADNFSVENPDIRSLSTSNLMVLESGLQRKVGAIASSGAVIDTPLMNLQEQGYVVVRSRGFDGPTAAELSVVTTCGRAEGMHDNDDDDGSPVVMSASLDERYWQSSASMENLADIRPPSSPDTVEGSVMDVLDANMDTQDLIYAPSLKVAVPDEAISAGDECLQTPHAAEAHEPVRDRDLWKRLWNTGVLELDLNLDLKQDTFQGNTAWDAKREHANIISGENQQDGSCEARQAENSLPQSLELRGSVLNVRALVPLPESPVNGVDGEYATFTPFYYLPSLPPSPEQGTASSFEGHFLLPPLPLSPVMDPTPTRLTFAADCMPLDMLPPLPSSPELPSKPLSITTSPTLLLLPPLPPSPAGPVACTPKSLEIASTKAQLRYWSQTAARLRDQEQVLTARMDVLIQEMAQVLDKCQETELGLLAKETVVQELRQELIKEQEFGFASVQEAALSIQEKCLLESALEESWKELGVLREAWVHQQEPVPEVSLPQKPSTVSAFENFDHTAANAQSSPSEQYSQEDERTGSQALVNIPTRKRPTLSTFFHSLVKLLCLALICAMALVSVVVLLYGQQYHLYQVYETLTKHTSKWCVHSKYTYRQFEAVAEEVLSHLQMLLQRKQKAAEDHVQSMTELFWTALELGADMDMAEVWQSLQISRSWS
ncbi:hypothetical protein BGZ70_008109 [Mortierella alpina]|uniref:Uncharacterized protein n=1 Tax=Mortierella alpina TaxID=64518 RepID=A0A9P6J4T6_MORAP|nr:hypothetical protein BGZ70_008109 [Mortierella alpina]